MLVTARQVQIAHQAIARIVFITIGCVVHARQFVAEIQRVVLARIIHRASDVAPPCGRSVVALSVKTPWQLLRGVVQQSTRVPGRLPRRSWAWSGNPGAGPDERRTVNFSPRAHTTQLGCSLA
jgi:hypothetical protein